MQFLLGLPALLLIIVFFLCLRVVFQQSRKVVESYTSDVPVYFPEEGIDATLTEKYCVRHPQKPTWWTLFQDAKGRWWNVEVSRQLYSLLEEGGHDHLLLNQAGNQLLRFGGLTNDEADPADFFSLEELDCDRNLWERTERLERERLRFLDGERLPSREYRWCDRGTSLRELTAQSLLESGNLPPVLREDVDIHDWLEDVLREAAADLRGYRNLPREGRAGDYIGYSGNHFEARLVLRQDAAGFTAECALEVNLQSRKTIFL